MTAKSQEPNPYDALERIFHEPSRLAIMSALCASERALTFTELKRECGLTDGNLNRHLQVLEDNGAVLITKQFVGRKPCTTVGLSPIGLERFEQYLLALQEVLQSARRNIATVAADRQQQQALDQSDTAPAEAGG